MKYIKVTGETHADALSQLRKRYGTDVIILNEKVISPKTFFAKLTNKKHFMIEAAIQEKNQQLLPDRQPTIHKEFKQSALNTTSKQEKNQFLEEIKKQLPTKSYTASDGKVDEIHKLQDDIQTIKNLVSELTYRPRKSTGIETTLLPRTLHVLQEHLIQQDTPPEVTAEIINIIQKEIPEKGWDVPAEVHRKADTIISQLFPCDSSIKNKMAISLIGTTGIGKTTTIAKLASKLKLKDKKKVGLISLDNYRIAATEQMRIYAKILDIPFSPCASKEQLQEAMLQSKVDVMLIDTAGTSPTNKRDIQKLYSLFESSAMEKYSFDHHLVLAANNRYEDVTEIINAFSIFNFDRIILTKIDETNRLGHLIKIAKEVQKPFSFFTDGQSVPDAFREADPNFLSRLILQSKN